MDVLKVAELARLKLNKEEEEMLGSELTAVLGYIEKLKEANIDGVSELTNPIATQNVISEDVVAEYDPEEVVALTEAAPEKHAGYVRVKQIFEE